MMIYDFMIICLNEMIGKIGWLKSTGHGPRFMTPVQVCTQLRNSKLGDDCGLLTGQLRQLADEKEIQESFRLMKNYIL